MNHQPEILGFLTLMWMVSATSANADPLAKARTGSLQCYSPDAVRKTCNALAGYTFDHNGKILNQAEVLLSPQQFIVMKTISPVEIRGEAVCGPLRKQDVDAAQIFVQGKSVTDAQAAQLRAQIETSMAARFGKEVCTTYLPQGNKLTTSVTVDGVTQPDFAETVIWVHPNEGYKVGP
ncbi:MAG: hypothetical protein JO208_04760 [Alphaproteobacteria bacterium]|nr:hypothetical protein [Alphaproteobacteria bacterium]